MKIISPIFYLFLLFLSVWVEDSNATAQKLSEKELIRGVRETKNSDEKIMRMIQLGDYYSDRNIKKAEVLRKKINYLAKVEGTKKTVDIDLYNIKIFKLERNFEGFLNHIMPYKGKDISSFSDEKKVLILQNLGYIYVLIGKFDIAKGYLEESLALANKKNYYSEICRANCYMAFNEMGRNDKKSALKYADFALDAANKTKRKIDFANSYLFQSYIYNYFNQPEIAISKELTAYTYAQGAQNYALMGMIAVQIGDKQIDIGNIKEADYYYNNAQKHAVQYEDLRLQGLVLTSIANTKRLLKKPAEALRINNKAAEIMKKVAPSSELGLLELHFAQIYIDNNSYAKALDHLKKSLHHYTDNGNQKRIKEVNYYTGYIYKKRDQYDQALIYLNHSIGEEYISNFSNEALVLIAEIYKIQGNNKKSLEYLEKYAEINVKSNKNETSRKIAELNELYRSEQRDELIQSQNNILEKQKRERELSKTKLENVSLRNNLQTSIIIWFIVMLILTIIIFVSRNRQIAIQQKRREVEMSQILLRTQMNPHFIFNAMSVIQSYIFENDVKNSTRFLVNFSRLIRLILENSPKTFINLETEIEILQKYLETQKLRFEDRFEFEIICPDELIFDNVQIPPMITQPFVENSIEHGQLHTIPNGKITINFSKQKGMLQISIEDNGIGRSKSEELKISSKHKSMALQITRNRINIINEKYNSAGYLLITDLDEENQKGTKVLISLPYITEQIVTN